MRKENLKVYFIELFLVVLFFFTLFASKIVIRYVIAFTLFIIYQLLKRMYFKRGNKYVYSKQVNILMFVFGLVYILIFYALGLYFGFLKSKYILSLDVLVRFIIPFTLIIILSELVRKILLSIDAKFIIKGKKFDLSAFLTFIVMLLIDLNIYNGVYDLTNLDDFLTAVGFVLFASIACNLLYNYITVNFGSKGIVIYRLITVLFVYVIPIVPDMFIFFRSFLRMVYPFILYLILENTYAKSNKALTINIKKKNIFVLSLSFIIVTLIVMLISCQFVFGIIVIGTESMTGTINKGDAVIYERYNEKDPIKEGQVIIFDKDGLKVIHRVIKIINVDGEVRYYTKGDANKAEDADYRVKDDVIGLVKLKVKYIGLPTIWLRSLFK